MTAPSQADNLGEIDNLVVGGGLAGSMVAIRLAAAGHSVTVLEKERAPHHKVCGEFLSPEAVDSLRQVGIDPISLGAVPIRFVRLSSSRHTAETVLPFTALSLSRFALDQAMLARAEQSGCQIHRGIFVEGLVPVDDVWTAQLRDHQPQQARTVFLANGKHDLRARPRTPSTQSDLVAFKLHWRLDPSQTEALRQFIELFLFRGGYGGLSLIEGGVANLCLVVRRSRLQSVGDWPSLLASILLDNPLLHRRLQYAQPLWPRPLAISSIPYGFLAADSKGLWRLGDQAAVIPSFTGDGIAIALHSASLAAEMYLAGETPQQYTNKLRAQLHPAMALATMFSRFMVTSPGRQIAPAALSLLPSAMRWIAASTRIPKEARLSTSVLGLVARKQLQT